MLALFVTSPTYRLPCTKWQHPWSGFATFKCQSLANRVENLSESCRVSVPYSIPVGMACDACSVWFPFKGTQSGILKCSVMKSDIYARLIHEYSVQFPSQNLSENCCVSVLYSIPVVMACVASSVWFPFKCTQSGIAKCSVMKCNFCSI